jgi:hypothetical protein
MSRIVIKGPAKRVIVRGSSVKEIAPAQVKDILARVVRLRNLADGIVASLRPRAASRRKLPPKRKGRK